MGLAQAGEGRDLPEKMGIGCLGSLLIFTHSSVLRVWFGFIHIVC